MKSFIKLAFMSLVMVLSFMIEPQAFHVEEIQPFSYVQASGYETLELISNNLSSGEIFASQQEENQSSLLTSPEATEVVFKNNLFIDNKSVLNGRFIHNLSTNSKENQNIRAP